MSNQLEQTISRKSTSKFYKIRTDGVIETYDGPGLFEGHISTSNRSRASHILPVGFLKRLFFMSLRKIFSDNGRVADWTRSWKCKWYVDLSPSGMKGFGPFAKREDAIKYEKDVLRDSLTW